MAETSADFNPYHKWLGIASDIETPNYYQLLAISPQELDLETIEAAYQQRLLFVQSQKRAGNKKLVSQVCYQLQQAWITLQNPQLRAQYDRQIHKPDKNRPTPLNIIDPKPVLTETVSDGLGMIEKAAIIIGLLVVACGVMYWFSTRFQPSTPLADNNPADSQVVQFEEDNDPAKIPRNPAGELVKKQNFQNETEKTTTQVQPAIDLPEVTRVTLSLDRSGAGKFSLRRTKNPIPLRSNPATQPLPNLPKTTVVRLPDRSLQLIHDFANADDPASIFAFGYLNARLLPLSQSIELEPKPEPGFEAGRVAQMMYGHRVEWPVEIICDLTRFEGGAFAIKIYDAQRRWGLLQARLQQSRLDRDVTWVQFDQENRSYQTLAENKSLPNLETGETMSFQLPEAAVSFNQPILFDIASSQPNDNRPSFKTAIRRLSLYTGGMRPTFGVSFAQRNNTIVVDRLVAGQSAEKSGLQTGDVIISLDNRPPDSVEEILNYLQQQELGVEIRFEIARNGNTITVPVIGE